MRVDTDEPEIVERIAALDVGKAEVVCCARVPGPTEQGVEAPTDTSKERPMTIASDPGLVTAKRKTERESGIGYMHLTIPTDGPRPVLVNIYDDGRIVLMSARHHHLQVASFWDAQHKGTYLRLAPTTS